MQLHEFKLIWGRLEGYILNLTSVTLNSHVRIYLEVISQTLKEHSYQSTKNYNVLHTQDSEIFSTILFYICYNFLKI